MWPFEQVYQSAHVMQRFQMLQKLGINSKIYNGGTL